MCEYCGNNSGLTDSRGNCISCGAVLPKICIENQEVSNIENIARWDGAAWSAIQMSEFGDVFVEGKFTIVSNVNDIVTVERL